MNITLALGLVLTRACLAGDFFQEEPAFLDHLKTCSPYSMEYDHPVMKGLKVKATINGKKGAACSVTQDISGAGKQECLYSAESIQFLTSPAQYDAAKNRKVVGPTKAEGAERMARECVSASAGNSINIKVTARSRSTVTANEFVMEPGIDRSGNDYRSFNVTLADPALCQDACAHDARCCAFTYVKPGIQGPMARCWLKKIVPAAKPSDCCTSGVKKSCH